MTRRLLTCAQVAAYIGCTSEWTRCSLADGTIPGARKVRGRWVIEQAAVDAWLDAGRPERERGDAVEQGAYPRSLRRTVA